MKKILCIGVFILLYSHQGYASEEKTKIFKIKRLTGSYPSSIFVTPQQEKNENRSSNIENKRVNYSAFPLYNFNNTGIFPQWYFKVVEEKQFQIETTGFVLGRPTKLMTRVTSNCFSQEMDIVLKLVNGESHRIFKATLKGLKDQISAYTSIDFNNENDGSTIKCKFSTTMKIEDVESCFKKALFIEDPIGSQFIPHTTKNEFLDISLGDETGCGTGCYMMFKKEDTLIISNGRKGEEVVFNKEDLKGKKQAQSSTFIISLKDEENTYLDQKIFGQHTFFNQEIFEVEKVENLFEK